MKKHMSLIPLTLILLVLLSGCAKSPVSGKWLEAGTGKILSFEKKGQLIYIVSDTSSLSAQYSFDEEASTLTIFVEVPAGESLKETFTYSLEAEDRLTLTNANGISTTYTKP